MKTLAAFLPLSLASSGGFSLKVRQQSCDDEPCQNDGVCKPFASNSGFKCDCSGTGYTGMYCDITQPKIICGDSYMSVTLDKKMITEHGFKDDIDNLKFNGDGEGCEKDETEDNFVMTIKSPFSECGTTSRQNEDGDFTFNNAISWKQLRRGLPGEAPVVQEIKLIDFNCVYEDQYKVSADGGIAPAVTTVDAETGLGNFTVELGLYRDQTFLQPYSENPVVKISNDVCVQLELKNSIREDVVLSASECWASSLPSGQGDRHELLLNKCANPDDPSLKVVQNGHSRKVQLCFEMFKWGEDMDQVYLDCNVNVCQNGGENINDCICRADHDYDIYYYSNYYYANYMKEMYENYKASQESGGRKRRSVRASGAVKLKSSNTAENEEETEDYTDFDGAEVSQKDDISEEIHAQIQWTVVDELTAAEQAKLSEVSRAEYEITPDEVIETIIAEIEKDDSQIIMIISIALMVAVLALGICIAVYVQCRRKYAVQRSKIREMRKVKEFYNGVLKPYNHSSHLPEQGSEQLPTVTN